MQHADNPWSVTGSRKVYENPWISLTEYDVINPGGGTGIYGKVHFRNIAVAVLALDEQEQLCLVGQYRFTLDRYSWEIPEGGCPIGSDPLEAAQRELREETGLVASEWTRLQEMHLSNSVSDELGIIYLAKGLVQYDAQPEETEQLVVRYVPLREAYRMVNENIITDSLSVAGIQQLWIRKLEKETAI
jgi:8-oxo-dGTP pyrophosphatase MutT (NUDIX family)